MNFATAQTQSLRRLRDEVKLPVPPGGAIIRTYSNRATTPPPIRRLFEDEVTRGITRECRFIAVSAEHQSQEERNDVVAHELVHAYILSSLGEKDFDKLPKWFHEGAALYLTNAKEQYENYPVPGLREVSTSPDEYKEYQQVFQFLEQKVGRPRLSQFIRETVQQRSVDEPLKAVVGTVSYDELKTMALHERSEHRNRNAIWVSAVAIVLLGGGLLFLLYQRGSRRERITGDELAESKSNTELAIEQLKYDLEQSGGFVSFREYTDIERVTLALVEESRALAKAGCRTDAELKLRQADEIAPPRLKWEVQNAWNELNGIYL